MLGRKREDGKRLKLYLCLRSKRDFSERLVYYRKLQSVYDTCQNYLQYNNIAGLIEKLMNDIEFYLMARRCLILENNNGCVLHFSLNPFSNAQIANYIYEYEKIIKAFEEDSHYAFLNEQLSWLGYSREKVEEVVCLTKGEEIQALKKEIEIIIESYLNIPLDKTQKDKMKNEEIKEPLMRLIKLLSDKDENKSLVEAIRKTDRGFSVDKFNEAMKITELMYYAENSSDKKFVIKRKM